MEGKTATIIGVVVLVLAGAIIALGTIPVSAFGGGQPTVICNLNLNVAGTYNDILVSKWISNFEFTYGASQCHEQTLLDLIPSSFNLLPFGLTFSVTLTATDGSVHGPVDIVVNIPAAQVSYPFSVGNTLANVPKGTYVVTVSAPLPLGQGGTQTYTTTISF